MIHSIQVCIDWVIMPEFAGNIQVKEFKESKSEENVCVKGPRVSRSEEISS